MVRGCGNMTVGKRGNKLETILFDLHLNNFQWFCRLRLAHKLFWAARMVRDGSLASQIIQEVDWDR